MGTTGPAVAEAQRRQETTPSLEFVGGRACVYTEALGVRLVSIHPTPSRRDLAFFLPCKRRVCVCGAYV